MTIDNVLFVIKISHISIIRSAKSTEPWYDPMDCDNLFEASHKQFYFYFDKEIYLHD